MFYSISYDTGYFLGLAAFPWCALCTSDYLGSSLMVSINNCSTAHSEVNCTLAASFSSLCRSIRIQGEPW